MLPWRRRGHCEAVVRASRQKHERSARAGNDGGHERSQHCSARERVRSRAVVCACLRGASPVVLPAAALRASALFSRAWVLTAPGDVLAGNVQRAPDTQLSVVQQ